MEKVWEKIGDEEVFQKAYEKQIPIKPIKKPNAFLCSTCQRIIWRQDAFCSNCGQAIKWKDEENDT